MSALSLTKNYADSTLLFAADLHDMWAELESKTNGNIDSSNVVAGWSTFGNVVLAKDTDFSFGLTASAYMTYDDTDDELVFSHVTTAKDFLFKIGGTTVATLDTSKELTVTKDIFFHNKSTAYPLSYLVNYKKPVLTYVDSTTVAIEQNTTTANRSLIVFPVGPIAVTEDVSATHKFRKLKIDATANGYGSTHTGAADSGMKVGLSLTANTWYFVYAAVVRYGDDAGNNYILVVDSVNPKPANWNTLDTSYGAGKWVYMGMLRYGHGAGATTTLVPFVYDKSGWLTFTGRAAVDDFFGIKVAETTVTATSYTTLETFSSADSGDAAPSICSHLNITIRPIASTSGMNGNIIVSDNADNVLYNLPSFAANLADADAHGFQFKIPNLASGVKLKGKTGV